MADREREEEQRAKQEAGGRIQNQAHVEVLFDTLWVPVMPLPLPLLRGGSMLRQVRDSLTDIRGKNEKPGTPGERVGGNFGPSAAMSMFLAGVLGRFSLSGFRYLNANRNGPLVP